jgi:hypothetical protein
MNILIVPPADKELNEAIEYYNDQLVLNRNPNTDMQRRIKWNYPICKMRQ